MSLLHQIHSLFRWVVLALGLVGIAVSFFQSTSPPRKVLGNRLAKAFVGTLDLQLLLGILLAILGGVVSSQIVLHGAVMALAVALGHVFKRQAQNTASGRILVYRFLAPVVVILAGHILLVFNT